MNRLPIFLNHVVKPQWCLGALKPQIAV